MWETLRKEEIFKLLKTDRRSGITKEQVIERRQKYGGNKLEDKPKETMFIKFIKQFNDFMIIILILASIVSAGISYIQGENDYIDSIIIIAIVILNAIIELPRYTPVSKFQPMRRDVAVVVPADFEVQVLVDAVNDARVSDARLGALVSFGLFDLYRPKTDEGDAEKSLAFAVELNSTGEEALTDAEADATMQALVEVLERAGARLRA